MFREHGGGGEQGDGEGASRRRTARSTAPVGALVERVVVAPAPVEQQRGAAAGGAPAERGGQGRGDRAAEAQGGRQGPIRRAARRPRRQGRPQRPPRARQHGDRPK